MLALAAVAVFSSGLVVRAVLGKLMELHHRYDESRAQSATELLKLLKLHEAEMLKMARESVAIGWLRNNGVAPLMRDAMDSRVRSDVGVLMKRLGLSETEAVAYLRQQIVTDNAEHVEGLERGLRNGA